MFSIHFTQSYMKEMSGKETRNYAHYTPPPHPSNEYKYKYLNTKRNFHKKMKFTQKV